MPTQYVPALSVLVVVVLLAVVLIMRLPRESVERLLAGPNATVIGAVGLFVFVGVLHLFANTAQTWTADLLKVLVGVLAAVGASKVAKQDLATVQQTAIGTQIEQAGRDIIQKMEGNISELRDSVVNVKQQLRKIMEPEPGSAEALHVSSQISAEDRDTKFTEGLKKIRDAHPYGGGRFVLEYVSECLANPNITSQLHRQITEIRRLGWIVRRIAYYEPVDGSGISVTVDLEWPSALDVPLLLPSDSLKAV